MGKSIAINLGILIIMGLLGWNARAQAPVNEKITIKPSGFVFKDLCPVNVDNTCFADGTEVRLEFRWYCKGDLVNFQYEVEEKSDGLHIYTQADVNIQPPVDCDQVQSATRKIRLPNQYGEVFVYGLEKL